MPEDKTKKGEQILREYVAETIKAEIELLNSVITKLQVLLDIKEANIKSLKCLIKKQKKS